MAGSREARPVLETQSGKRPLLRRVGPRRLAGLVGRKHIFQESHSGFDQQDGRDCVPVGSGGPGRRWRTLSPHIGSAGNKSRRRFRDHKEPVAAGIRAFQEDTISAHSKFQGRGPGGRCMGERSKSDPDRLECCSRSRKNQHTLRRWTSFEFRGGCSRPSPSTS